MSALEQDVRGQGPGVRKTGLIPEERFIVMSAKKVLALMMSAALVLAGIP